MRIDVHTYTNRFADNKLHSCTAIVIDVLRATTSIIRAAQNGALKIIACLPASAEAYGFPASM